ncbi:NAD(P)-dependent dehydrogenase (short-subunit alcohol dehydrogenase family) [Tamaricihabitans halophyticus]|uniref:NAD(P)-dependent dehydrogenase (Short-subunit alcohol dehydrogenase family) n=1 Tax=Tamaricihabitans halophyticus TaxID=1262583 RepID=A0A4R2Q418_9PSEU|nr:glucose 1-dehydrogenase [Tamaricihabitans halophyticus]TCP42614.1 NAD(P)-dependent dehydrogenase (short-subunit alcohol dehydrogenase family) [Tamaricihabitans halophyticus]
MNPVEVSTNEADPFDIRDKTVVVTGGSRGIGYMIASGLVDAGARVLISSRKAEAVAAASAELARRGNCQGVAADIATSAGRESLADAVHQHWNGRLHVLVNNAGATWGAPVDDFPEHGWDKVLDTNVKGVFQLTTEMLPALRSTASSVDPARVINIGSTAGLNVPALENYSYSASKAAVHMLTRHLAKRLAAESITVNAIAPGWFETSMSRHLLDDAEQRAQLLEDVPLRRVGGPSDIAGAIRFLASRSGSYLTGTVLPLDGGVSGCS